MMASSAHSQTLSGDGKLNFSYFDGDGHEPSSSEIIPHGTVDNRIRQLRRMMPRDRQPLTNWRREERWDHEDVHGYAEEIHHDDNDHSTESDCAAYTLSLPQNLRTDPSIKVFRDRLTSGFSEDSALAAPMNVKRKSAMDLYHEYGIPEPVGLLSGNQYSDLSLSADGSASPRPSCHVCHLCSHRTAMPAQCTVCGHRFCADCACERLEDRMDRVKAHASVHTSSTFEGRQQQQEGVESTASTKRNGTYILKGQEGTVHRANVSYGVDHITGPRRATSCSREKWQQGILTEMDNEDSLRKRDSSSHRAKSAQSRQIGSIGQNPFVLANRSTNRKRGLLQDALLGQVVEASSIAADQHDHSSSHMEDIHDEHEDIHRHHSHNFHGISHISEHLAAAAQHDFAELQARAHQRLRSRRQETTEEEAPEPAVSQIRKNLEPRTPVHAVTGLSFHSYVEEPIPSGHPSHHEIQRSALGVSPRITPLSTHESPTQRNKELKSTERKARRFEFTENWKRGAEELQAGFRDQGDPFEPTKMKGIEEKSAANKISSWQHRIEQTKRMNAQSSKICPDEDPKPIVPSPRVNSPPSWLKRPQKHADQEWMRQKLRHVSSQNPHDTWRSHQMQGHQATMKPSPGSQGSEVPLQIAGSFPFAEPAEPSQNGHFSESPEDKSMQPWIGRSEAKLENETSYTKKTVISTLKDSLIANTPRELLVPRVSVQEHRFDIEPLRDDSSRISTRTSHHIKVAEKRDGETFVETKAEPGHLRVERTIRKASYRQSPSDPKASGMSTPAHILPPMQLPSPRSPDETFSESQISSKIVSHHNEAWTRVDKSSELDLHRPSAVVPSNHECCWKDRYMALTSEIRQLKAELSSTHMVETSDRDTNHDETTLGIKGLTIVMHLKDKDDLVINTDLTQEADE